ncbi:hypothetical protein Tco_1181321 [Tanacetum coccineum]
MRDSRNAFPSLVSPPVSLSLPLVSLSFQPRTYNLITLLFHDSVQIQKVPENNLDVLKVSEKNLEVLKVLVIRVKLAELYESEELWSKAAQMLSGIDLDSEMSLSYIEGLVVNEQSLKVEGLVLPSVDSFKSVVKELYKLLDHLDLVIILL